MKDYNPDWHRLLSDVNAGRITLPRMGRTYVWKHGGQAVPRQDAMILSGMTKAGLLVATGPGEVELSSVGRVRLTEWNKKAARR